MTDNVSLAQIINEELDWFQQLVTLRTKITFEQSVAEEEFDKFLPPDISESDSPYADLISKHQFGQKERLVLILALIPHVKPSLLDILYMKNTLYDVPFTEFGGVKNDKHKGYLPSGETAMFLLAGDNIQKRVQLLSLFAQDHTLRKEGIISLNRSSGDYPLLNAVLSMSQEYVSLLLTGEVHKPDFSQDFPAKRITTQQNWDELVLSEHIMQGLDEIQSYLTFGKKLKHDYQFGRKIKPGFKVLFTGPPGTGKTLTVSLLGKSTGLEVYRVDLSMVVSKYIGETEKNLSRIFDKAESKNWILFFDEADALFGKRSNTSDAHDRYANQEVSFLLQRMEDFDGLVILCSNLKRNIDEAFFRRFQLVLDFDLPDMHQRQLLWEQSLTEEFNYEEQVDLSLLAETYELTAASIINILHYCILKAMKRDSTSIRLKDIRSGIRIEKIKEGKSIL